MSLIQLSVITNEILNIDSEQSWQLSHFVTRDPRDPWPMTQFQTMAWVDHDYLRFMMSSRLLPSILCSLKFWIWLMQYVYSKSSSLHGNCYKLNTINSSLIMGQVFYGTDHWSTWPIHICRPIWPMSHDPLTHCMICFRIRHIYKPLFVKELTANKIIRI